MVGGTTFGYWAMGRRNSATPPMSTKTMASTLARTGRSMKNLEIMSRGPGRLPRSRLHGLGRGRLDLPRLRGDLAPRYGALVVADHHLVVGGDALGDLAQTAEELADLDDPLLDRIVLVHHQQIAAELARADGRVRHQQGLPLLAEEGHPGAGEEPGDQPPVL